MLYFTPLWTSLWFWLAFWLYWVISAAFVYPSKTREPWWRRLTHQVPMIVGFYLIYRDRHQPGIFYGRLFENYGVEMLGLLITLTGLSLAVWARVHLGKYWSGIITLKDGHRLIRSGPYRLVRHPIYTGLILAAIGGLLSVCTGDAIIGVLIVWLTLEIKRRREEKLLATEFGDEYRAFQREVPALVPYKLLASLFRREQGTETILQSRAFQEASMRSERYRVYGLLAVCAAMFLWIVTNGIVNRGGFMLKYMYMALAWWGGIAIYQTVILLIVLRAQRRGRRIGYWFWILNTIIECLLPSIALIGLSGEIDYLGPYRALYSAGVGIYYLFIILSTLRLRPTLCILSGIVCAGGYLLVYRWTIWVAPHNQNRAFMPARQFFQFPTLLLLAGFVAAGVARQIRSHVIAALNEVETRRKLDRLEYDLNIARTIQMGLLPKSPPKVAGYDIAGWSQPADQTGGDYYDWMELPDGRILFTIADAAGHGIGPALLIAACRAYFRAIAAHNDPLEKITQQVDELIAMDITDGRFITAAIALLDPQNDRLSLYSAGHAPLYLYNAAENRLITFEADQPPLGTCFLDKDSRAKVIDLSPGDYLLLVTDGFFECGNAAGELLGIARLGESILHHQSEPSRQFIRKLYEDVLTFSQGSPQADDLTAVVIKRT